MQPTISWYEGTNTTSTEVKSLVSYGIVNADSISPARVFYVWNNRKGLTDCSNAEDVTFTTRDMSGGLGDTVGSITESVRDNWFQVRCDSLGQSAFKPVGKGGTGTANPSGTLSLGTNGKTTNVNAATATVWSASGVVSLGDYIKPTVDNGFIYKVTQAGVMGATEPTWLTTEGLITESGTAQLTAVKIDKVPPANTLLGLSNNAADDGTNADIAGGNWTKISVQAEVPINASSGKQSLQFRVSYRFV